jgi:hypothetical protein
MRPKPDELRKRRIERLAKEIQPILEEHLYVQRSLDEVDNLEEFRAAIRLAGHRFGAKVWTRVRDDLGVVWGAANDGRGVTAEQDATAAIRVARYIRSGGQDHGGSWPRKRSRH